MAVCCRALRWRREREGGREGESRTRTPRARTERGVGGGRGEQLSLRIWACAVSDSSMSPPRRVPLAPAVQPPAPPCRALHRCNIGSIACPRTERTPPPSCVLRLPLYRTQDPAADDGCRWNDPRSRPHTVSSGARRLHMDSTKIS